MNGVTLNHTYLLSQSSGGQKSDGGAHWPKIKVFAGPNPFCRLCVESVSLTFPVPIGHPHSLASGSLPPSLRPARTS